MSRSRSERRGARRVCVLWVAGVSAALQIALVLEGKELTTHLGSPSSSDPPREHTTQPESIEAHPDDSVSPSTYHLFSTDSAETHDPMFRAETFPVAQDAYGDAFELDEFAGVRRLDGTVLVSQSLSLTVPSSVTTNLACGTAHAVVTWNTPSAASTCGGVSIACTGSHLPTATPWSQAQVHGGGAFPAGLSEFCCQASDACSDDVQKCWSVNVQDQTAMQVTVELSPTIQTSPGVGVRRCIEFEVFQNCIEPPVVFQATLTFGGPFNLIGRFHGVVLIPGAIGAQCVTARDPQHTLRACYVIKPGDCQANGILKAGFVGDPTFNGNWLVGGNFDGWRGVTRRCRGGAFDGQACHTDSNCPQGVCESSTSSSRDLIDILDFGVLVSQWLTHYDSDENGLIDGHAACESASTNHADANGDGMVDLLDFSIFASNFLRSSADCCCPGAVMALDRSHEVSYSLDVLRRVGRFDLVAADVNRDGMLDLADLRAFLMGQRPVRRTTGPRQHKLPN